MWLHLLRQRIRRDFLLKYRLTSEVKMKVQNSYPKEYRESAVQLVINSDKLRLDNIAISINRILLLNKFYQNKI